MRIMTSWMRVAKTQDVPAIILGLHGRQWDNEELQRLTSENGMQKTHHQFCHFGIQACPGQLPSRVQHRTITTFQGSDSTCGCSRNTEHVFEYDHLTGPGRSAAKEAATAKLCHHLAQKWQPQLCQHRRDLPTSSFPTHAKEKEKERKLAGHVPTKKVKVVEKH